MAVHFQQQLRLAAEDVNSPAFGADHQDHWRRLGGRSGPAARPRAALRKTGVLGGIRRGQARQ